MCGYSLFLGKEGNAIWDIGDVESEIGGDIEGAESCDIYWGNCAIGVRADLLIDEKLF